MGDGGQGGVGFSYWKEVILMREAIKQKLFPTMWLISNKKYPIKSILFEGVCAGKEGFLAESIF